MGKNIFDDPFFASRTISATNAFRNVSKIQRMLAANPQTPVYLIKNSEPVAVITSIERYSSLIGASVDNKDGSTSSTHPGSIKGSTTNDKKEEK